MPSISEELKTKSDILVDQLYDYLEDELGKINLSQDEIRAQTLEQLQLSLNTLDKLKANKYATFTRGRIYSVIKKFAFTIGTSIDNPEDKNYLQSFAEAILDYYIEQKVAFIQARINLLLEQEKIVAVQDKVSQIPDVKGRDDIIQSLEQLRKDLQNAAEQSIETKHEELKLNMELEAFKDKQLAEKARLELEREKERSRLRTQTFQDFLNRETIATLIGAVFLTILMLVEIGGMIWSKPVPEILNNSFLIILGYFFGQSVANAKNSNKEEFAISQTHSDP